MPDSSSPVRRGLLKLLLSVREVVDLGPATSAAIVTNTFRTEARRRRDDRARATTSMTRTPGMFVGIDVARGEGRTEAARCRFTETDVEIAFLAEDLVRVTWGDDEPPVPWAIAPSASFDPPSVTVTPHAAGATCATPKLRVEVSSDGSLSYFDAAGTLLRHELAPLRRGASRTARHELREAERLSGLGEQAGSVDLTGGRYRLFNRDPGGAWGPGQDPLYCAIPVTVGLHPAGDVLTFYENSYDAVVQVNGPGGGRATGSVEVAFRGGALRHYVAVGPLPHLLDRYSQLTGRPPMPPRWALGYHQCKWGYKNEMDIREVSEGFAAEGVPLSAVHLDIDYMDGYRVFSVDRAAFSDLASLAGDLMARGTRIVTIVDPAVKHDPGYDVFAEGVRHGHFLLDTDGRPWKGVVWPGPAVFPDFTDPSTRRWWSGQYARLLDQGVAGIWHDMNEPTSITLWGDRTLPMSTRHSAEGRGGDHRECHNVYGNLMNQSGWEALVDHHPDRRPFILSRAGWAGLQRHAWNWTADIEASWSGLAQQIPTTIGLGLSGVPYTGSDIGGFSGVPTPELYLRWLELSVLMPFCRTHCVLGSPPREPWRFPEPHRGAIGRLIRFRYRLLPYLYTLAHDAAARGLPLVRPLAWPAPGAPAPETDPRLWHVDDAYLLGDALLVAPVSAPGATERPVVLPAGDWYRWRPVAALSDEAGSGGDETRVVEGGRTLRVDAPAGQPVLFVRAGTVLPLDDGFAESRDRGPGEARVSAGHEPRVLGLHVFPDAHGAASGHAYDDAGDGYGAHRLDHYSLHAPSADALEFRWDRSGDYRVPDVSVVLHGLAVGGVTADGAAIGHSVTSVTGVGTETTIGSPPFSSLVLTDVDPPFSGT